MSWANNTTKTPSNKRESANLPSASPIKKRPKLIPAVARKAPAQVTPAFKAKTPAKTRAKTHVQSKKPVKKTTPVKAKKTLTKTPSAAVTKNKKARESPKKPTRPSSPRKLGLSSRPATVGCACNHALEPWVNFQPWDDQYFKPVYMEGRNKKNFPSHCKGTCAEKEFCTLKKGEFDVEKMIKVTKGAPVMVCPNATRNEHPCVYAICKQCINMQVICADSKEKDDKKKKDDKTNNGEEEDFGKKSRAARRNRSVVNPGE
jgi:hypothetical protein